MKPPGSCLKGFRRNVQMRSESLLGRVAQQCTKWRTPSLSFQKVTVGYSKRILYNLWVAFCLTAVGGHLFSLPFFFNSRDIMWLPRHNSPSIALKTRYSLTNWQKPL